MSGVETGIRSDSPPLAFRRIPVKFRKATQIQRRLRLTGASLAGGIPCRSALSQETLADLDRIKATNIYSARTTVFIEGEPNRGVFILCQGRAKLTTANSEGKTLIVRIAAPGEILGLGSCLAGGRHETTLETTQPSRFAFVRRDDLLRFLSEHEDASRLVTQQLIRDCRAAYDLVRYVGLSQSTHEKLARFLLRWAAEARTHDGARRLKVRFTHDEIGQMIGATRETVTRALGLFRREHMIEFSESGLLIRNMTALRQMVN